jgi:hypothetical protein
MSGRERLTLLRHDILTTLDPARLGTAVLLLRQANTMGVDFAGVVDAHGKGNLNIRCSLGWLTPELVEQYRDHEREIIAVLEASSRHTLSFEDGMGEGRGFRRGVQGIDRAEDDIPF